MPDPFKRLTEIVGTRKLKNAGMGIDPGISGAIAIRLGYESHPEELIVLDSPIITRSVRRKAIKRKGKKRAAKSKKATANEYDVKSIVELAAALSKLCKKHGCTWRIVLERPPTQLPKKFGESSRTAYLAGASRYIWETISAVFKVDLEVLMPVTWRARCGITGKQSKEDLLEIARKRWPNASLERKKDNDRAEAMLIATLARPQQTE